MVRELLPKLTKVALLVREPSPDAARYVRGSVTATRNWVLSCRSKSSAIRKISKSYSSRESARSHHSNFTARTRRRSDRMKRRGFFIGSLALAVLIAANAAIAQTSTRPRRLGVLAPVFCPAPDAPSFATTPLIQALTERGWIEGRSLIVDCVAPGSRNERIPALAAELVARKPDVLFGATTLAVRALKQATTKIPIVTAAPDPLRSGIVTNLARPEANVTGVAPMSFDLVTKRAELLRDLLPRFSRLAVIFGGGGEPIDREQMQADISAAGNAFGFTWKIFYPMAIADIDEIFAKLKAEGFDVVYFWPSSFTWENRERMAATAVQYSVPTISDTSDDARAGVLLSYGVDYDLLLQSTAEYVDKILRGAKPADLPLQQPTKLQVVINLRIAKALGLRIPTSILIRADEIIE